MTMHCMSGACGSLGTMAALSQVPVRRRRVRSNLRGLGQSATAEGAFLRWPPPGPPTDDEVFGRGCSPSALPQGEERRLVESLMFVERSEQSDSDRCSQNTFGVALSMCRSQVERNYATVKANAQAEINAYCAASRYVTFSEQPFDESAAPVTNGATTPPAAKSNTILYLGIGAGVLALLGGGYLLSKGRR